MFYTYRQNNSGGSFIGPHYVVIEADSPDEADRIAEGNGLYFFGVDAEIDCECCGDRWYPASEWEAADVPSLYGEPITDFTSVLVIGKD